MTKFNIGDIVKYKKQHHLILDVEVEQKLWTQSNWYIVLTLDNGDTRELNARAVDVAGRKKA